EQRADRTIHQAADQDLRVGRAALAPEEAAGDLARRVELLLVLAGERHEVDVARLRRARSGHEHHAVAAADDDRATGLLGPLPGLDGDFLAADDGGFTDVGHERVSSLQTESHVAGPLIRQPEPSVQTFEVSSKGSTERSN